MKPRSAAALILAVASVIGCERSPVGPTMAGGATAGASAAATPAPQSFTDHQATISAQPGPGGNFDLVSAGTETMSGVVNGSFAVLDSVVVAPGGTAHFNRTLTGTDGTISIRIDARFVSGTSTTETVEGAWTIATGSGAYTGLHGSGSYSASANQGTVDGTGAGFAVYDSGS